MNDLPGEPGIHYLELAKPSSRLTLALPQNFEQDRPFSLVIALHYAGPVTPFYGSSLLNGLIEPGLRELGAVIAAPDCPEMTWDNERSEALILDLLSFLGAAYPINMKSILLTGYSIGGIGSWYIAGRSQDKITAAIPLAAKPPKGTLDINWTIPLRVIHGSVDELFPIGETRQVVDMLQGQGAAVSFHEVPGASHFETGKFYRPLIDSVPWIRRCWSPQE